MVLLILARTHGFWGGLTWDVISEDELFQLIQIVGSKMLDELLIWRFWSWVKISPGKWNLLPWGDECSGFWVVAVAGQECVYFNDIEDGFNISQYRVLVILIIITAARQN